MSEFIKILDEAAGKAGFNLTPMQLEQFDTYYRMLVETNKVMNLTALTEPQDVAVKHFVDSLMAYDTYFPGKFWQMSVPAPVFREYRLKFSALT